MQAADIGGLTTLTILNNAEWQVFDCKRALIKPSKLLETVCAFANSDGGVIALGVEDPAKAKGAQRLIGIKEGADNVSDFIKLLGKEFDPPLVRYERRDILIKNTNSEDDLLVLLYIVRSDEVHSLKNGDTYVRNGRQNTKIGNVEISRLKYQKGSLSYESETTVVDIDDLDSELVEKYKNDSGSKNEDTLQFLRDNGFAKKQAGKIKITNAGALLFGKNPSVALGSKVAIKISHYHGTTVEFSGEPNFVRRPFSIEGPAISLIERAIEYFRNVVHSSPPKLSGAGFKPSFIIPEEVFQEAITNAVVHRNYSIQNDIQVRFFDDRVEVVSPGAFPGHVNRWNIRSERFARNPIIQRALNRFENAPNLDIGEGVDRMYQEMMRRGLYEPLYLPLKLSPNSVYLVLLNTQKIEIWDIVHKYLVKHDAITNGVARKITGVKDSVEMSRLLKQWVENGLLEKAGSGKRNTIYRLSGSDPLLQLFSEGKKINEP